MAVRTGTISWVHFGDLHLEDKESENYRDFLELMEAANENLAGTLDFAFLPGDNSDNGVAAEYELVRSGLERLRLPVHVIAGDHDRKSGTLKEFQRFLTPELYRSAVIRNFHLLFLNAMDGPDAKTFDITSDQMNWVKAELETARATGRRALVFVHLYPSELVQQGRELSQLIHEYGVEMVDMGHTHYNELANDGQIIHSTTRSTGQIEEGPPGFSLTVIEEDVISWKFKQRGPWPFLMITSPSDYRLITDPFSPTHVVRGIVEIRARAWNRDGVTNVVCSVGDGLERPMRLTEEGFWCIEWDSTTGSDGLRRIQVTAECDGNFAEDVITVHVSQRGDYVAPRRCAVDYENAVGAWPEKGILGTQLGPNENGTKGPWPSWQGR